ncbi:MAG: hypothetical protein QOG91_491 [Candidatus Parcubacteria bacterium]|jgi:hypothetical protein|nr:hypothetical protein [Candidatus Parcubacteria bacterium]
MKEKSMNIVHIVGFEHRTEQIRVQVVAWIQEAVRVFEENALWKLINEDTKIVCHPNCTTVNLCGIQSPYIIVQTTEPLEGDAIVGILRDLKDPPLDLFMEATLATYIPAKRTLKA